MEYIEREKGKQMKVYFVFAHSHMTNYNYKYRTVFTEDSTHVNVQ